MYTPSRQVREYFPGASAGYCLQVWRHLHATKAALDDKQLNELLQGYARCLQKRGWSVSLFSASGSTVLMQVTLALTVTLTFTFF